MNNKKNKEMLDKLQFGYSIKRVIHKGYEEYERCMKKIENDIKKKTGFQLTQMFGKYQYILRSEKGEISVIQIKKMNFGKGKDIWGWEIYSWDDLFTDTEHFKTKKKALEVAKKYLT